MISLRWIGIVAALLLGLGNTPVAAQSSADAFFHDAAQRYVAGNLEAARRAVTQGLDVAPSDPRLRALREKLRRRQKKRGGGQSARKGAQSRKQPPRSRGRNARRERSRRSGEARSQARRPSDAWSSRRSGLQSRGTRQETQNRRRKGRGGPQRQNALSRAQAARLLRALENQEMKLLRTVQVRGQKETTSVAKDW